MEAVQKTPTRKDYPDGTYLVQSVYPTRKDSSIETITIVDGMVHSEKTKYVMSIRNFFYDHQIVCKGH